MGNVALPIDPLLPEIVRLLQASSSIVLEAPPGAGKTTRVPRALLEHGLVEGKEIVVLQPRRLATRLAAQRVSEELGERIGETVGYQVRFEDISGPKTRLRFVTEGVLGRRLLSDPKLSRVGMVVLDEFHERHLAGDISLALLRQLQLGARPDLKIVAMSATLDAAPIAAYLGGCPNLRSEGRRFDVSMQHLPAPDERRLDEQVLAGLKRLHASGAEGDVLVFLPGAGEIRRAEEACSDFAQRHGMEIHALHGDLGSAEQDRAVRPSKKRKLIFSTNVAETSVTIDGVAAVIDSGLAREASYSPWSGLPSLKLQKISKASATQRAGRAGRTRPGVCLRLYTQHDFDGRIDHQPPEVRRMDLAETALALHAGGFRDLSSFPFFEAPPMASLEAAGSLLQRLGAVSRAGELTDIGRRLLRFPVHPRQGRLLIEAEKRGVAQEGALVAALLGERDIRQEARARFGPGAIATKGSSGPSDLLEMVERFKEAERADFQTGRVRSLGLESGATQAVERVRRQLSRLVNSNAPPAKAEDREQALMIALLAGYPDRVAKRRRSNSSELVLSGGGSATLAETSVVREPSLMVTLDAEERGTGKGAHVLVRLASQVEPEWILDLFPDELVDLDELQWNADSERVERVTRLSYGALVLEERRSPAPPTAEAARALATAALQEGFSKFVDPEALAHWRIRLERAAEAFPEAGFARPDDTFLSQALAKATEGMRSFAELREADLLALLQANLTQEQSRLLSRELPEKVALPGNRWVKVNYEPGKPPWVESRLQDFFGMAQGPRICAGRVSLVLHLLAPNHRAVQVTTDLAGFWSRHYAGIRKELMRKYPRHSWPEDPTTAQPPAVLGKKR